MRNKKFIDMKFSSKDSNNLVVFHDKQPTQKQISIWSKFSRKQTNVQFGLKSKIALYACMIKDI